MQRSGLRQALLSKKEWPRGTGSLRPRSGGKNKYEVTKFTKSQGTAQLREVPPKDPFRGTRRSFVDFKLL